MKSFIAQASGMKPKDIDDGLFESIQVDVSKLNPEIEDNLSYPESRIIRWMA